MGLEVECSSVVSSWPLSPNLEIFPTHGWPRWFTPLQVEIPKVACRNRNQTLVDKTFMSVSNHACTSTQPSRVVESHGLNSCSRHWLACTSIVTSWYTSQPCMICFHISTPVKYFLPVGFIWHNQYISRSLSIHWQLVVHGKICTGYGLDGSLSQWGRIVVDLYLPVGTYAQW